MGEKTSNFYQQGKEWANWGINHYQQNRRTYQGVALTGLLITGGIAAQHYSEVNSTNSLSVSNLDLGSSFVPNCVPETNNLFWESKFNDLNKKFSQREQKLLNEKKQLDRELDNWKSIFPNHSAQQIKEEWAKITAERDNCQRENQEQKEQINNLKSRPTLKDYQDLQSNYNSLNTTHHNYQAKYKFSEQDIKEAIAKKEQEWKEKGLINPHNQSEIEQENLIKKAEYERIKAERDSRPEITLSDHQQLLNQQNQTQREKDQAQAGLEAFNQQLDETQQELVHSQRRESKLTKANSNCQKQIEELKANKNTIADLTTQLENKQQETAKLHEEIASQKQSKNYLQALLNSLLGGAAGYALNGKDVSEEEVKEFVEEVNNLREHVCLSYPNDYENLKTDKDKLVQEITLVKSERDRAIEEKNDYKIQGEKQEKKIVQELNESLSLGLKEPALGRVIQRIKELISKPPIMFVDENTIESLEAELNETRQTAKRLEKELTNANGFAEKDLVSIAETTCQMLEKILPESTYLSVREEIQQATSYQQIVQAQTKAINNYLAKNTQTLPVVSQPSGELGKPYNQERAVLISLLVVSLLSVGGLLVKVAKSRKKS
ncbi:MAG: hypothetical protein MRECE_4c009 [Mycoplasmataceae bacterium CE_OT135]|nr:MAG: hypothetical protein MRECE_4c009 [Mycoplasmataceae bacterium CE_OT135]